MRHIKFIAAVAAPLALLLIAGMASKPAAAAANQCLRLALDGGSEVIVNMCDQCRVASIIRSRPGNDVPVGRKYNVQPKSTFPVPFRGPGRSRITSDFPCPGEAGGDQDLLNFKAAEKTAGDKCVSMERADGDRVMLVNRCGTCRAVAIERMAEGAKSGVRDYFLITGGSRLPVEANGFSAVGLLGDIPCPS